VSKDAKAQLGVFIEHLALWHIVAKMGGDESVILQHLLQQRTNLLPPCGTRVSFENAMTVSSELLEGVGHE
jgi:hypothetical protein